MSASEWWLWVLAESVPLFVSLISALSSPFMGIRQWFESTHPLLKYHRKMSMYWVSFGGICRWWRNCATTKGREMRRTVDKNRPFRAENVLWALVVERCVSCNRFWVIYVDVGVTDGHWPFLRIDSNPNVLFLIQFNTTPFLIAFTDCIHNPFSRNRELHENVLNIAFHPRGVQPVDVLPHWIEQQSKGVPALVKE